MAKHSAIIPFWFDPQKKKYRFVLIKANINQDFIVPKGKIESYLSAAESAAKEAEEEAGVLGQHNLTAIGRWERNEKRIPVFLLEVQRLLQVYKEDYRTRILVYEDEYQDFISDPSLLGILDRAVQILSTSKDFRVKRNPVMSWTTRLNALFLYLNTRKLYKRAFLKS